MKKIHFLLCGFCFCSCNTSFFIDETKQLIERNPIQNDSSAIRFISKTPLSGVLSKEYYLIKAYFLADHSRLDLFSHFRDFGWEDGINVQLERKKTGLVIKISVSGYPAQILFEREDYFLNSNEVDFSVEVENGTNYGFRVRIWENFVNKSGILKNKTEVLTGENLVADSLLENLTFYTRGQGLKWGFRLFRSRLIEGARVSSMVL